MRLRAEQDHGAGESGDHVLGGAVEFAPADGAAEELVPDDMREPIVAQHAGATQGATLTASVSIFSACLYGSSIW